MLTIKIGKIGIKILIFESCHRNLGIPVLLITEVPYFNLFAEAGKTGGGRGCHVPPLFCEAKLYVVLDSKVLTEVLDFEMIHYILGNGCSCSCLLNPWTQEHFLVSIYLKLSSGRYPENDFKTFLTITILEIIYIVFQLGKISDRYVLLISSRYW